MSIEFSSEYTVKATKKEHKCGICGQTIDKGQAAVRWSSKQDGEFMSYIWHTDCREAEIALNKLYDSDWDDWSTVTYDMQREDLPWLKAEFPKVFERLGFTI